MKLYKVGNHWQDEDGNVFTKEDLDRAEARAESQEEDTD